MMKIINRKRRRRRRRVTALVVLVVLAAISAAALRSCIDPTQQDLYPQDILGVPMYTQLIPEGDAARPGIMRRIKYIVLHETGNFAQGANAKSHSNYLMNNNPGSTSWHYTVDEDCIYHHVPDTEVAWHAGDGQTKNGGNMCGIGVEICVNQDGDFDKAFENAAKLTAYLINAYDLSIKDIRQHGDFISKNCPQTIRDEDRMDEFTALVEEYMELF